MDHDLDNLVQIDHDLDHLVAHLPLGKVVHGVMVPTQPYEARVRPLQIFFTASTLTTRASRSWCTDQEPIFPEGFSLIVRWKWMKSVLRRAIVASYSAAH